MNNLSYEINLEITIEDNFLFFEINPYYNSQILTELFQSICGHSFHVPKDEYPQITQSGLYAVNGNFEITNGGTQIDNVEFERFELCE